MTGVLLVSGVGFSLLLHRVKLGFTSSIVYHFMNIYLTSLHVLTVHVEYLVKMLSTWNY